MRWSSKTVLITGGAGFIGRNLSARLLNENAEVIILDNFSYAPPSNVAEEVELITVDVSDSLKLKSKLSNKDIDFVFHFASPSSVILFDQNPVKCFNETIASILNIFDYARENNVRKVIFPSSGSVYGKVPPPQSEDQIARPVNLYGIAKLSSEYIASYLAEDVKYVGLRIFAGYGIGEEHKRNYASPVTLFLKSIQSDTPPIIYGDGTQSRDFVYIDDIVEAAMRSCEVDYTGILNVGSGVSCTFNDLVMIITELTGKNIEAIYISRPKKYLERTRADITRMSNILGIKPLNIEKGLVIYYSEIIKK